jgi:hypothetical protein
MQMVEQRHATREFAYNKHNVMNITETFAGVERGKRTNLVAAKARMHRYRRHSQKLAQESLTRGKDCESGDLTLLVRLA